MNKKVIIPLIIISLFAMMALALTVDTGISNVNLVVPTPNQNVSGNLAVNITAAHISGTDGNITSVTVSFWNASDLSSLVYSELLFETNESRNTTYTTTVLTTFNLPDGSYNISINATNASDGANLENNSVFIDSSEFLMVDNTPNPISFNTPTDRTNYTNTDTSFVLNVTVTNSSLSATHVVIFQVTNGSNVFNRTASTTNLDDGYYNATFTMAELANANITLTVYANDTAGNMNDSEKIYVVHDNVGPTVTITNSSFSTKDTTPTLSFSYTPGIFGTLPCILYNSSGSNLTGNVTVANGTVTEMTSGLVFAEEANEVFVSCTTPIGNQTNSSAINITIDNTAPTISAVSASSITTTSALITVTSAGTACKYDTSNKAYGSMASGPMAVAGSTHTLSKAGLNAGTAYTIYARCKDALGNTMGSSSQGTFTTTAQSSGSSGGSSSGGGSTGSSAGVVGGEKRVWNVLDIGEKALVPVSKDDLGVTQVTFSLNKKTYGAWLKVVKKDTFPTTVKSFARKTFKQIEVVKGMAIKDSILQDAKIDFKVEKTWLADNKLTKGSMALFRFNDGAWVEMKTSVGQDDGTFIHYSSETPGFSYFVIGEREDSVPLPVVQAEPADGEVVDAPVEETGAVEEAQVQEAVDQDTSSALPVVVVVLLLVVGVIVYFSLRHK
jgi:PGF-pre-PGF domain-containing protein